MSTAIDPAGGGTGGGMKPDRRPRPSVAGKISTGRMEWRQRCAWDQAWFTVTSQHPHRRYCSRACANRALAIVVPDDHWQRMALASATVRRAKRDAQWAEKTQGMTAAEAGAYWYRQGHKDGWSVRERKLQAEACRE